MAPILLVTLTVDLRVGLVAVVDDDDDDDNDDDDGVVVDWLFDAFCLPFSILDKEEDVLDDFSLSTVVVVLKSSTNSSI